MTAEAECAERIDIAVNIFAKPFQSALSLLSLLEFSGRHVGVVWLQFEPYGSKYDTIEPYYIARYLQEKGEIPCKIFQPEHWQARNKLDIPRLCDPAYRYGIRYQYAFEHSQSRLLFLFHNDVFVFRDILGAMLDVADNFFAVGPLGQCWNCPAHNEKLMWELFRRGPCEPRTYAEFRPSYDELCLLYTMAHRSGVFARPYELGFVGKFDSQPWPLPECRVNEWACLLNLRETRPHCLPEGRCLPPGAFEECGPDHRLDTAVAWFRGMNALGMRARHFDVRAYMKHWVGTGKKTARTYRLAEDNAFKLLRQKYPDYLKWLSEQTGRQF